MIKVLIWDAVASTCVSIPYRYGTTTVFTASLSLLYALFSIFQPFFVKKVGRPQFLKSPQTRIFTAFF